MVETVNYNGQSGWSLYDSKGRPLALIFGKSVYVQICGNLIGPVGSADGGGNIELDGDVEEVVNAKSSEFDTCPIDGNSPSKVIENLVSIPWSSLGFRTSGDTYSLNKKASGYELEEEITDKNKDKKIYILRDSERLAFYIKSGKIYVKQKGIFGIDGLWPDKKVGLISEDGRLTIERNSIPDIPSHVPEFFRGNNEVSIEGKFILLQAEGPLETTDESILIKKSFLPDSFDLREDGNKIRIYYKTSGTWRDTKLYFSDYSGSTLGNSFVYENKRYMVVGLTRIDASGANFLDINEANKNIEILDGEFKLGDLDGSKITKEDSKWVLSFGN